MVLTITVVGNNEAQNGSGGPNTGAGTINNVAVNATGGGGHTVLSPNELAQLMSGQTVTGLLNPDGTITLNSNVMSTQQLTTIPTNIQNGGPPMNSSTGLNYSSQLSSSISNMQPIMNDPAANNNNIPQAPMTGQKKTVQKRLTAKQKLAQQQQQQKMQQQQQQHVINTQPEQSMNQQPQVVATVQLPNGQIGQLIAPSGGQFWSPNAINLQQLSMAVAAATGTIPQTMSIPNGQTNPQAMQQPQQQHQINTTNAMLQQQQQQQTQQLQQSTPTGHLQQNTQQHQQQNTQSLNNHNQQQQQVVTAVQMTNSQMGHVVGRQGQNQIWSGGPISLTQLSALAQQGVVQLSPIQGIPTTSPNGQRMMEMIPQATIQGLLNQNGQPLQAIPLANGGQFITQDPNDPNKWQVVQSTPVTTTTAQQQQSNNNVQQTHSNITGNNDNSNATTRSVNTFSPFISNNSTQSTILSDSPQSGAQPQRKLKRLACTCPNCRDGDNSRTSSDKKKQHICHFPDCNKVYGKTSHLRAHLRWHSGERPYVCSWSFCGKKFTRSDELQRHRRTHTGEKRFQCSECLKRFMRSDHLSKHLKTHLSSKKANIDKQYINGTMVEPIQTAAELEENMIDDQLVTEQAVETDKSQLDHSSMKIEINNPS